MEQLFTEQHFIYVHLHLFQVKRNKQIENHGVTLYPGPQAETDRH